MKKKVLFLCTGNSARSQMAEGLLRSEAGGSFEAYSAGTRPAGVNPLAVKAMQEAGIDISRQASKSVEVYFDQQFDYVITLCGGARQECPVFPGNAATLHWDLEDPAAAKGTEAERAGVFRKVRDEIRERIRRFIGSV
ncbi:MAG: arsenate reductase ArsC [Endomicrobiales bacterium]